MMLVDNLKLLCQCQNETYGEIKMRKLSVIGLVSLSALAGCQDTSNSNYLYKSKPITLAEKNDDTFECRLAAAQAVPTDKVTTRTPTWTTPVSCNTYGGYTSCTGGQTYGGNLNTTDMNSSLRAEYKDRCLAKKGYVKTSSPIPKCEPKKVDISSITMASLIHQPVEGACWTQGTNNASIIILPEDQKSPAD
jgi:hypothetical protein